MQRRFRYELSEDVIRGMNREQYYAASHWLRLCCREAHKKIDWEDVDKQMINGLSYGSAILGEPK